MATKFPVSRFSNVYFVRTVGMYQNLNENILQGKDKCGLVKQNSRWTREGENFEILFLLYAKKLDTNLDIQ